MGHWIYFAQIFTLPRKKAKLEIWSLNHDSKLKNNSHSHWTQIMSSSFQRFECLTENNKFINLFLVSNICKAFQQCL